MYSIKSIIYDLNSCDISEPHQIKALTLKAYLIIASYIKTIDNKDTIFELNGLNGGLLILVGKHLKPNKKDYSKARNIIVNRLMPVMQIRIDELNPLVVSMYSKIFDL